MKNLLLIALSALILIGCSSEPEEEVIVLEKYEDKLGYVLGARKVKDIMSYYGTSATRLDKEKMLEGFKAGLETEDLKPCMETIDNLFGENGMDFNEMYLDEGSRCIGLVAAATFYSEMKSLEQTAKFNNEKLVMGFEHALYDKDTIVSRSDQAVMFNDFLQGISLVLREKVEQEEKTLWDDVKKIEGIEEIESGIWIETVKEGTGGSPSTTDDVQADYILVSLMGDTLQSSFDRLQAPEEIPAPAFNLTQVYEGWRLSFPHLKKGGKYRLYLPYSVVNDQRLPQQSYYFYVEFLDYGPANTLAKPQY
jgi:FKBP-type peptidyl-prolyl cis-trans isomerase